MPSTLRAPDVDNLEFDGWLVFSLRIPVAIKQQRLEAGFVGPRLEGVGGLSRGRVGKGGATVNF
uniref:Uncharacterized protein n=1 Tax=Solanum lycopersicum TaxID=4081 RepID=A0A3Q7GU81_SOLLC